jgi:type IV secretory pathway protease TraF
MDAQPRESDERENNRPRVRRLSWWFAIAVVGGVAAAIAGVWAGASRPSTPKLANSGVRTEKADDGWLNREPDHFASAEATAAIAPVMTPAPVPAATPMAEYQPPAQQAYQALPPCRELRESLPGDTVEIEIGGVSVNGVLWPESKPLARDSSGRRLEHYPFGAHRVRPGELWLLSDNPRGWDSRYFGPVALANVVSAARPLLIFK